MFFKRKLFLVYRNLVILKNKYCCKLQLGISSLKSLNTSKTIWKELSFCRKLSATCGCKLLIFQTSIIWSNRINSLKYLRSTTLGCQDIGIRIIEFVAKTQFLCVIGFCLENRFQWFVKKSKILKVKQTAFFYNRNYVIKNSKMNFQQWVFIKWKVVTYMFSINLHVLHKLICFT